MVPKRNLFPVFVTSVFSWLLVAYIFYDVRPKTGAIVGFWLICLCLALVATSYFLNRRLRRSILFSLAVGGYLWLRLNSIDTPLNILFFLAIIVGLEFFLTTE